MSNKTFNDIKSHFDHSDDIIRLAEKAAPGAVYFGMSTSFDAEYDDDSGYYMIKSKHYTGLYDTNKQGIKIQDPNAYEEFFNRVEEYFDELNNDDDSDDYDDSDGEPGEHVTALEMVRRTGYTDDLALQLLYQEGDLIAACESVPDILDSIINLAIGKSDSDLVEDIVDEFDLTAEAISEILEFDTSMGTKMLHQVHLRSEHLITIYQALKNIEDDLDEDGFNFDLERIVSDPRCPTNLLEQLAEEISSAQERLENRETYLLQVVEEPNPDDPVGDLVFVAQDSSTPLDTLHFLSAHDNWEVRAAVANSPLVTVGLLEQLSKDTNSAVRLAAENSLKTRT